MSVRGCGSDVGIAVLLVCVTTGTLVAQDRNPNPKFHAEIDRLSLWTAKNRAERHVEIDFALLQLNPFSGSKVTVQKVAPGASVVVTVPGDYPAGSVILSERDLVTLSGVTMSARTYAARMTVAPEAFPGFSRLFVVTPISYHVDYGGRFLPVAFVDAVYRIDLKSPDGTMVKVAPREKTFTIDAARTNAQVAYQAQFFRPGETTPFETVNGEQHFNSLDEDRAHFEIGFSQYADSPQAEIEELSKKMADPKITEAQRNALMQRLMAVQQKYLEDMTKGLQTDPASLNKRQEDFGCGTLQLYRTGQPGGVEGTFICGQNFHGGYLKVAGTMNILK
jgi:hypothetical protein